MKNKQEIIELLQSTSIEDVVLGIHIALRYFNKEELEGIHNMYLQGTWPIRLFMSGETGNYILLNGYEILSIQRYPEPPKAFTGFKEVEYID